MAKRGGGKFGGNHTTLIDLASELADIAAGYGEVTKVSPGFIDAAREGATGGRRHVKFEEFRGGLLLKVRQSYSVQAIRVYTDDPPRTRLALAREARNRGIGISFLKLPRPAAKTPR